MEHTNTMNETANPQCDPVGKPNIENNLLCQNGAKILTTSGNNKLNEVFSGLGCNLNVVHIHCQGIKSHHMEILDTFKGNNVDAILMCETWLTALTYSHEIKLPGYTLIRNDKEDGCGGVAIYLRESLSYKIVDRSSNKLAMCAEHLLIEISHERTKVLLGIFYSPLTQLNYFAHFERLLKRHRLQYDHVICLGDFKTDLLMKKKRLRKLLDIIDGQNLFVFPVAPSITDLILASSSDNVAKYGHREGCYSYSDTLFLSYII